MNLWRRFRNLLTPLLMLHVTGKFVFGVGLGVLLGGVLRGYGWWIIVAAFVIAIPSSIRLFSGK